MDDICTQVIEELHTEDGNESSSLQEKVQLGILECEGSTYPLYSGENIIGRDKTCDIIIPPMDGSISRRHALIVAAPNAFFVSDFGSLNGTYIGKDKLEPNVRYHVDEKSDLKIGTVFITVRKATKDEECGSDQSGYDSDTILTEETSGKQVESEETKAVEDDEVATQFDEPEIVEPSVVQDEDENLTDFEESTPEDQEFLDDTETCTKVTTEPNTSPSHRSPPPSDTPAKNILDLETQALPGTSSSAFRTPKAVSSKTKDILEMETQADDNILNMETQAAPGAKPSPFLVPRRPGTTQNILSMETQAADNILEIETQADDNILNMETQAATGSTSSPFLIPRRPSRTPNILSMETQAADNILNLETQAADNILNLETQADDNILNMETQATPGGSSSSFRTPGRLASKAQNILDMKTQAEDNILNLETQADDNILNMETQATAGATPSPSHTSGRMAHKPPNILNLETQAEENILNMETQASPGAILSPFSTPGSKVQNILNLETQAEDNILDMETQATPGATPSPFSTPGSKVQTILNLETQAEVNILEMETQASSGTTPSPFRTPGRIAGKTSTILVMETQEEEEDVLNMETQAYPGATSSPLNTSTMLDSEKKKILAMETQADESCRSLKKMGFNESISKSINESSDYIDNSELDDSLASPAPKPSTKSAAIFVMETQEDSCTDDVAEKSKDAEQSGILDASTSSTEKHAKRSLNDVLSCEALNIQSDATTRNSMSNFEKSTDVPEKNDKIQGTLLESDDSSNDSFIINTPIKQKVDRSEVIKTDATKKETRVNLMKGSFDGEKADDSKVVWATETQDIEDDNADDSFSCTAAVTIPESQDIDDLIEGTPPPSPSNKAQSTSMNNSSMNSDSSHSRSKSFNLVYRDTDESQNDLSVSQIETEPAPNSVEEIPISQIETQIAPTSWEEAAIEQERGKLSPLKTTSSISSPVAAEKSANESDELSTSQIETQIAPTCWEEAADEQERGKLSPPTTTTNIPSPLPVEKSPNESDELSMSQIETQIAPTCWEEAAIEQDRGKLTPSKITSFIYSPMIEKIPDESGELSMSQVETQIAPTCWEEVTTEREKQAPPESASNVQISPSVAIRTDNESISQVETQLMPQVEEEKQTASVLEEKIVVPVRKGRKSTLGVRKVNIDDQDFVDLIQQEKGQKTPGDKTKMVASSSTVRGSDVPDTPVETISDDDAETEVRSKRDGKKKEALVVSKPESSTTTESSSTVEESEMVPTKPAQQDTPQKEIVGELATMNVEPVVEKREENDSISKKAHVRKQKLKTRDTGAYEEESKLEEETAKPVEQAVKKSRGRKKLDAKQADVPAESGESSKHQVDDDTKKRGRSRTKKVQPKVQDVPASPKKSEQEKPAKIRDGSASDSESPVRDKVETLKSSPTISASPKTSQRQGRPAKLRDASASDSESSTTGKVETLESSKMDPPSKKLQRGRPAKAKDESASDTGSSVKEKATSLESSKVVPPSPTRRGRPEKARDQSASDSESSVKEKVTSLESSKMVPPSPKRRGRPTKVRDESVSDTESSVKGKVEPLKSSTTASDSPKRRVRPAKMREESPLDSESSVKGKIATLKSSTTISDSPKQRGRPAKVRDESPSDSESSVKGKIATLKSSTTISDSPKRRGRPAKVRDESPSDSESSVKGKITTSKSSTIISDFPKRRGRPANARDQSALNTENSVKGKAATLESSKIVPPSPKRSRRGRPAKATDQSVSDSENCVQGKAAALESSKMVPPSPKGSQQEIPVRNESASDFASSIRGKFATLKSTAISASPKRSQRGRPAKSRDESASDSESSVKDKASSKIVRPTARRGRPVILEDESESDSESSVKGKVATKSQPKVKKGKESSKMEPPQTVSTTEPTLPAAGTSKQMPKRKAKSNHLIFTSPDIFSGDRRKSDSKKMTESSTNVKKPERKKRPLSQDSNSDGSPRKKPNVSVEYSDSSDLKDKSQSDSSTTSVSRPARGKVTKPTASLCYENTSTDTENETEKETATKKGKKLDRKETSAEPRGSRSKSQKSGSLKRLSSENLSLEQPQVRRTRHASPSSSSVGSPRTSSQRSRCSSVSSVSEKKISETAADSKEKHVVVFSGYIDENQEKIVKKLGGEVVGTIPDGNCVLVVRNLGRTLKVLSMLARGLPIVKENWILDCQKARKFLDPWLYLIHDKPAEEKYGFSLRKCLEARRNSHPVFEGWTIMGTGSTKPPPLELQGVVENAGGKFITSRPKTWTNNSLVVTCDEDKSSWSQLSAKNAKQKPKLVKISAIWESIEHQTVITEGHEFHA